MSVEPSGRVAPLPRLFEVARTASERTRVRRWWRSLDARDQRDLSALCDPRAESCSYHRAWQLDGSSAWYGMRVRVEGRFVDASLDAEQRLDVDRDRRRDEDNGGGQGAFPIDFYEYLRNHELTLDEVRTFHVCTQHEAAAEVVRAGLIPATFTCPLGRSDCPMRRLLAVEPGRSVRLVARRA